jgi:hypothetical protein
MSAICVGNVAGSRLSSAAETSRVRLEHPERFGDREGAIVRQHDAPRAEPDAGRLGGQAREQDFGRRIGEAPHRVMFGEPKAFVAERFRAFRERDRGMNRIGRSLAG